MRFTYENGELMEWKEPSQNVTKKVLICSSFLLIGCVLALTLFDGGLTLIAGKLLSMLDVSQHAFRFVTPPVPM